MASPCFNASCIIEYPASAEFLKVNTYVIVRAKTYQLTSRIGSIGTRMISLFNPVSSSSSSPLCPPHIRRDSENFQPMKS